MAEQRVGGDNGLERVRLAGPVGPAPAVLRSCARILNMSRRGFSKLISGDGGKNEWSRPDRSPIGRPPPSGNQPQEGKHSDSGLSIIWASAFSNIEVHTSH